MEDKGNPPPLWQMLLFPLWLLISLLILLVGLLGIVGIFMAILALVFDTSAWLQLFLAGEVVNTNNQAVLYLLLNAIMAFTGGVFWWLRSRGQVVGALWCYAFLMVLFLLIAWYTGSSNLISVGFN